jgi:transmembrane sensor
MGEHRVKKQDFKRAVSEARAELERLRMPAAAASRVRARIDRQVAGRARTYVPWVALVAAGAAAAALLMVRARPPADRAVSLPAGFETLDRSPDLELAAGGEPGAVAVRAGSCTLRLPGWGRITVKAGTRLRRESDGVDFLSGAADFQVDKRAPGSGSTQVRLPQGVIEITGTHFSVMQEEQGGSAQLFEGEIRFHAPDGRTVTLAPGQSIGWPLPPATTATTPSTAPLPVRISRPVGVRRPAPAADIIDRISALRAQGRYRELADELQQLMDRESGPRTRERLSFELGTVLSYHLTDAAHACAHWAEHARTFPGGHYAPEVSHAQKHLHCEQ